MTDKVKIDIVSDVVCPWCIIGYKRLEQAIVELGLEDKVEIEWQPFELNPNMPAEGENLRLHAAKKYGTTPEGSVSARNNLTQLGAEVGFGFDFFDEMKMVNTRDTHILLEYAKEQGKQTELKMRLFAAFFSEHKDVSDHQVLAKELETVGLDANAALARLEDADHRQEVEKLEAYWQSMGISSVPTVVFNRSSAVTGAQSADVFKQVLTDLVG